MAPKSRIRASALSYSTSARRATKSPRRWANARPWLPGRADLGEGFAPRARPGVVADEEFLPFARSSFDLC